jgi:hypothetical protein
MVIVIFGTGQHDVSGGSYRRRSNDLVYIILADIFIDFAIILLFFFKNLWQ